MGSPDCASCCASRARLLHVVHGVRRLKCRHCERPSMCSHALWAGRVGAASRRTGPGATIDRGVQGSREGYRPLPAARLVAPHPSGQHSTTGRRRPVVEAGCVLRRAGWRCCGDVVWCLAVREESHHRDNGFERAGSTVFCVLSHLEVLVLAWTFDCELRAKGPLRYFRCGA